MRSIFHLPMLAPRLGSDWDFGGRGIVSGVLTIYACPLCVSRSVALGVLCVVRPVDVLMCLPLFVNVSCYVSSFSLVCPVTTYCSMRRVIDVRTGEELPLLDRLTTCAYTPW